MSGSIQRHLKVEEVGFYESIEFDERGLPKLGKQFPTGVIPPNLEHFELYFRLSGKPGSYWLTIDVKSEGVESDVAISFDPFFVRIPVGGDTHLTIPFSIDPLPRGNYLCVLSLGGQRLAGFGFTIS